jgi:hypothetical protein
MSSARIQQIALVSVGIMVVGSVSFFGSLQKRESLAATSSAMMYVSPASGSYAVGSTIPVAIREDSGAAPANVVQATLRYDTAQLEFVDMTEGRAFAFIAATLTDTPGQISLARAIIPRTPAISGDNLVATLNFRVLATEGPINVSFNTDKSLIIRSGKTANIMVSSLGGSYTVKKPSASSGR